MGHPMNVGKVDWNRAVSPVIGTVTFRTFVVFGKIHSAWLDCLLGNHHGTRIIYPESPDLRRVLVGPTAGAPPI